MKSDQENEFEKQGVTFKIITDDMAPQVTDFMWKNFFPNEPTNRSLGSVEPNWLKNQMPAMASIKTGVSIAAVNENGEILAVRLGVVKNRNEYWTWIMEKILSWLLSFAIICSFFPKSMKKTWVAIKLFEKINYDAWAMFDKLGCDKLYEDKAVCSARDHGIRGLGTEIVRRSERLAADLGCTHTVAAVTGIYSQRIFTKLGHTTLTSLDYDDFRDENGELYLKDTREHTKIITAYKKLID